MADPFKSMAGKLPEALLNRQQRQAGKASALARCLSDYLPTIALIGIGLLFYTRLSQYFIGQYRIRWTPTFGDFAAPFVVDMPLALQCFAALYAVVLIPYYLARPHARSSASVAWDYVQRTGVCILRRMGWQQPAEAERQALLCLLLKFIFIPFCIHGMLVYLAYLNRQFTEFDALQKTLADIDVWSFYNQHFHYFLLNLIFLVDFIPFVIGYLIQAKSLDNEIVSVDSSLAGWAVCLLCYPPFNAAMVQLIPFQVYDLAPAYPDFSKAVHLVLNVAMLVCFALYASASVSLGFKCSNLTNRGVVASGLYGVIRHPAYVFKNAAWWLGALPIFIMQMQQSFLSGLWAMLCLAGWTFLYGLRAIREERHLLSDGNGYREYQKQVPYRFVPGVV